jgi:anti-sigma factor RsiW
MESHRPFEGWLLGDDALTALQQGQLRAHLDTCPDCRALAAGRTAFEESVRQSPMQAPGAGFTARWVASLSERHAKESLRQAAWIGLGLVGSAAAVAALLLILVGETLLSPWAWIVQTLNGLANLMVWGRLAWEFTAAVINGLPSIVPGSWELAAIAAGLGLSAVWLISLYRLALQSATTKGETQ